MKKLGEKSNWQKLSKRSATETLRNRDVYETQQLDRGQIKHKQSFLSRHLIAIALGILGFMLVWSLWSFTDVGKLDEIAEAERTKIIVNPYEPAAEGVRDFPDAMWANMILVPDTSYSGFGYVYRDSRTGGKYTQVEYDYWSDIQRRIRNGEMPNLLSRTRQDGTIEYKERDPLLRAPDYPRHFSDAQYLNFREAGMTANTRYADLGYTWYVSKYNQYLTQAEYEIAMAYTDEKIASLIETGQLEYREQTNDNGEVIAREYRNVVKYAELVIPTEDAGDRYLTPIVLDNLTWANMVLKANNSAASLHYTYADTRTGYFYTTVEYEHWKKIKSQAIRGQGDCKFWMEISPDDGEYIFSNNPAEPASNLPRDSFLDYPVTKMMQMVMRENQFWSKYGYGYFDTFTGMFYSQAEYDLWMDVQKNVENGTYIIPDDIQAAIREKGQGSVTDIVWNALTPLPVKHTYSDGFAYFDFLKFIISLAVGFTVYALFRAILKKNLDAQNLMNDTSDINQYENDQHIALPEEIQIKFDWFPDAGAHCPIQVSSMISHMMLTNKGLKSVTLATRADKDIKDKDGEIEYYKGEILLDDKGEPITKSVPMIDTDFGTALYEASGAPKEVRKSYDPTKIPYNPDGADRTKQLGVHKTVADAINATWTFPLYEPQRPAGAYMVDTEPVNTMVLAITRAGKGQTVIEPTIDMWTRESNPNNMVINDPKGELLVKNYVRGSVRGFQIVQFNLINAMKTDIYNPLGMAADAAREGDFVKCAMYVDNIASVFFPLDGGDDPVWPNAANNAFKRAAYGLMDYYLEEEKALRLKAERINLDPKVLETMIDQMWGKVTLYNCYQFFVQLTSKKLKNPLDEWGEQVQQAQEWVQKYQETITEYTNKVEGIRANIDDIDEQNAAIAALGPQPQYQPHANPEIEKILRLGDEEFQEKDAEMNRKAELWDGKPEADLLSLYFSATDLLPRNSMRNLVSNANNALKSMAGAEKMLASVYGIAITAMSFFTDPTISTLTSGTPSQNVDLAGMSFPRRLGVRLHPDFLKIYHLVGLQAKWTAYEDDKFEKALGKDFNHEDLVTREGWCRYYFKGLFPNEVTFLKLQIKNAQTNMLVKEFFFKFEKSYQTSLDGRFYVKDPVLGTRIVKNGVMTELKPVRRKKTGEIVFVPRKTTFKTEMVDFRNGNVKKSVNVRAIIRTMCRYSEKPKMVFLVTPPHLMNYAKLILILIKQLVDLNFDQSYMTKDNQKPLYKTRFMLDELGNLQSEGHGISGFETMLSIGLGQEQQFTLILQTLQQLKDVYGDSVDKIVQGNTSNIVFLKSTDDAMIETLQKMSGTTHKSYTDSKSITRDMAKLMMQNEGKTTYTMSTKEVPVITYNDMAFISERNSIIFRAGDAPIWNRNETILPMSWRLFKNTITQPGKSYTLQTIPTLSTALDFDIRQNQPDFMKMLDKRMAQAVQAPVSMAAYREAYGYNDTDMSRLDIDSYSDEVMEIIEMALEEKAARMNAGNGVVNIANPDDDDDKPYTPPDDIFDDEDDLESAETGMAYKVPETATYGGFDIDHLEDNTEVTSEVAHRQAARDDFNRKIYAGGYLSKGDFIMPDGSVKSHALDKDIIGVFTDHVGAMVGDTEYFSARDDGGLNSKNGVPYIVRVQVEREMQELNDAAQEQDNRVFADNSDAEEAAAFASWRVTDEFYKFLASLDSWTFANGVFEEAMKTRMADDLA